MLSSFKRIREQKQLSKTQLAYNIGKDPPSINRLEKVKISPSYIYLVEICGDWRQRLRNCLDYQRGSLLLLNLMHKFKNKMKTKNPHH